MLIQKTLSNSHCVLRAPACASLSSCYPPPSFPPRLRMTERALATYTLTTNIKSLNQHHNHHRCWVLPSSSSLSLSSHHAPSSSLCSTVPSSALSSPPLLSSYSSCIARFFSSSHEEGLKTAGARVAINGSRKHSTSINIDCVDDPLRSSTSDSCVSSTKFDVTSGTHKLSAAPSISLCSPLILETVEEVRAYRRETYMKGGTIGFVPTMGYVYIYP